MIVVSTESELEAYLKEIIIPGETVVAGLGNELRCDDGFGVYVTRSLSNFLARYSKRECLTIIDVGTSLESYIDVLNTRRVCIVLDVIEVPTSYSDVVLLKRDEIPSYRMPLSTHTIHIDSLLGLVGSEIYVIGTRPVCLDIKLGVTRPVAQAIQKVVKAVIGVLRGYDCLETPY